MRARVTTRRPKGSLSNTAKTSRNERELLGREREGETLLYLIVGSGSYYRYI